MSKISSDVLKTVIALEVSKGHLKWKVTDLARQSKVGRELIYYHFGKTKKAIFERSFELIAEEFYGLTDERTQLVREGNLLESLRRTHAMFMENPAYGMFYLKWRTSSSPLRDKYIELEQRYEKRLALLFPNISKAQIQAIHAFLHGLVTAPFLTEEGLIAAADYVTKMLKNES